MRVVVQFNFPPSILPFRQMLQKQDEGKLTRGYPLGTTGVQKRRRGTLMSWSYEQQHLHAFLQPQLPGQKHVYLRIDNTTAVAYINKRGATRSPVLTAQALELCAVALDAGVSLTAQHIPGIQNTAADTASRQIETRTECTLDKKKIPIHLSEVLQTRIGSLCIPLKSSSSPVCFELPGSGSTSCRRLSPRLEQMDL